MIPVPRLANGARENGGMMSGNQMQNGEPTTFINKDVHLPVCLPLVCRVYNGGIKGLVVNDLRLDGTCGRWVDIRLKREFPLRECYGGGREHGGIFRDELLAIVVGKKWAGETSAGPGAAPRTTPLMWPREGLFVVIRQVPI